MRKNKSFFRLFFLVGLILTLGYIAKFVFSSSVSSLPQTALSQNEAKAQTPTTTDANPSSSSAASSQKDAVNEKNSSGAQIKGPWAASAPGRVEPKEGEIRITAQSSGEIIDVIVKSGAQVQKGDLLVRLDDRDLQAKLSAALAEEGVRLLERNEEVVKDAALDRRKAEDAFTRADRTLYKAKLALDEVARKAREGEADANDLEAARKRVTDAQKKLTSEQAALEKANAAEDLPYPSRLESSLTQARSDIFQIENAIERTRIRAPSGGSVLNVWAKVGEVAVASPDAPIVLLGDVSSMRVRTEVEERASVKVRVGQKAVVRSDAYPGQDFTGTVTSVAPALGPQRITSRGPRKPNDIEVLEVMVVLDGQPPLLTGMRVDVYFRDLESS